MYQYPFNTICLIAIILITQTSHADDNLKAIESNQLLKLAESFDPERNGGKPGNQLKAEQHYLEFLTRTSDWQAQAWVYCRLGALYSTNFDPIRGEKANFPKANRYFAKCIELTGNRITHDVIRARSMMILPSHVDSDQFQKRMDFCQWAFPLLHATVTKQWYPKYHPIIVNGDRQKDAEQLKKTIKLMLLAHQHCMVYDALATSQPVTKLQMIIDTFPQSDAAILASKKLKQLHTQ